MATLKQYFDSLSTESPKAKFIRILGEDCGVSSMTIYRWMEGKTMPDKLKRERISELTGINTEELFPSITK